MRRCFLISSLTLLLFYVTTARQQYNEQDLLKWVVSQGGYFNPKQEMRHDDDDGLFGVFASQSIEKHEVLASIPWDCVIGSDTIGRFEDCDTVEILAQELTKKEPSVFASTLVTTVHQHEHLLPTNWSKQGQALLLKVTDNGILGPHDPALMDFEWKNKCDQISKDATLLVLTHGEDIGMVPISDKYNSRAGNYTGAYFSIEGGEDHEPALEVRALRFIAKGEQIYTNYKDYGQIGTPELLRDYGFVEMYPQRYIFPSANIAFDILQSSDSDFEISWIGQIDGMQYDLVPSSEAIHFLREQLERLKQVYSELLTMKSRDDDMIEVPDNELQVIVRFCRDYKTAIAHALHDAMTSIPWNMKTYTHG